MAYFLISLSTIIAMVNPIGVIAPFLAVTNGMSAKEKHSLSKKACFIAGLALMACAATGQFVFDFYGITLPAVKISGGLLVLLISMDMLHAKQSGTKYNLDEQEEAEAKEDAGIFPLSIPLMAGPGSILATFLLMEDADSSFSKASVFAAIFTVMLTTYILLRQADHINQLLGKTGVNIISRLMGLILAAIAVQFILDGLTEALPGLKG